MPLSGFPKGRVLVVDDDHDVCKVLTEILESAGLDVVCVQSDRDAYRLLDHPLTFKALLVDVNLGAGVTGFDLARHARQGQPEIVVLYLSGQVDQESFNAFGVPGSRFLPKPFSADELLGLLAEGLAARPA